MTSNQTNGIGSRGNTWQGVKGNLFFSFVIDKKDLANDLPLQSTSIYFSFLLKSILEELGSKLWLKWPNDFYIENKKIGGCITSSSSNLIFCGIGLNLHNVNNEFDSLDINISIDIVLAKYFDKLKNIPLWQDILNKYVIEFDRSKNFQATMNNRKVSLSQATLNSDGSIQINNKKVFSLR